MLEVLQALPPPLFVADHVAAFAGWLGFYLIEAVAIAAVLKSYAGDQAAAVGGANLGAARADTCPLSGSAIRLLKLANAEAAQPNCQHEHPLCCPSRAPLPSACPQAPALSRLTTLPKKMLPLRLQLVKSLLLGSTGLEAATVVAGSSGLAAPSTGASAAAPDLSPTASAFVVTEERPGTTATLPRPQYPPTLPLPKREQQPAGRPQTKRPRPAPRCAATERAVGLPAEPAARPAPFPCPVSCAGLVALLLQCPAQHVVPSPPALCAPPSRLQDWEA